YTSSLPLSSLITFYKDLKNPLFSLKYTFFYNSFQYKTIVAMSNYFTYDTIRVFNQIKALYALITLLILQQINGNIIVPKVVGKNANLHPLLVMLSLFMFGSLFGIIGMIVAVLITALIKHFVVQFINRRLEEKNI